jgi:hypothetical protein
MASRVFRKIALDRLSSPEQLDQLVQVTPPRGWAALGILTALLAAGVLWGWFGSVSVEVFGDCVLQPRTSAIISQAEAQELEAIFLLPLDDGKKVSTGTEAHVFLDPGNEQRGFILGDVRSVQVISRDGRLWTQVEIALRPGQSALSGYNGSSSPAPAGLNSSSSSGARIAGKIVLQRNRPLSLLVPGLHGGGT